MRCSRSSDDQFDDYDGELQHLVVHHGGGHQAEGGGGALCAHLAPTGPQEALFFDMCLCAEYGGDQEREEDPIGGVLEKVPFGSR